jgi:hypothetical protein
MGLYIPLSLLGNGSINTFSQQYCIVGGVTFCAVHDKTEESRQLVLLFSAGIAQ